MHFKSLWMKWDSHARCSTHPGSCLGLALALLLAAAGSDVAAQTCNPQNVDSHFGELDGYIAGTSVALDGDTAAIGVPGGDPMSIPDAGFVRVRVRVGTMWSNQAALIGTDPTLSRLLGYNVAVKGDTIATVGANAPAIYVFTRSGTTWTQQQKIFPNAGTEPNGGFGALAISGNTLVAGAPNDTANDDLAGAVFVFVFNGTNWVQQAKLRPADTAPFSFQRMGTSVAIDGDTLVAGAPLGVAGRAAYVFVRSGGVWAQQQKIQPPDLDNPSGFGGDFGKSVSLDGNRLVVGAPTDQQGAPWVGAAYFFARSGSVWSQEQKLVTPPSTNTFGTSATLSGDRAVVGAYADTGPPGTGEVHVLVREGGTWSIRATITTPPAETNDAFGFATSFDRNFAIVGAPYRGSGNRGVSYIYELGCTGACCLDASTCSVLEMGLCEAANGNFRGVGSNCIGMSCEPACCRADVNGDQSIDGLDIQDLVDALLQGDTCP